MCRGKILIAEDDLSQLAMFKHGFEDAGYTVLGFADGAEIVDKVHKYQPDLVILDVHLPPVDGWQIARKLKADPELRHISVIMVSADQKEAHKDQSMLHGCMNFLEKPVDTDSILSDLDISIRMSSIKKRSSDLLDKT